MLLFLAETDDTLLTGFSGFLILIFVIWLIWKLLNRSR